MAGAFGFSVGDLIAGLRLVYVSVGAVRGTSSVQTEYAALSSEVQTLLGALETIDELDLEHRGSEKQWSALQTAVLSCKRCVEDFLASTAKYQPHLQVGAKGGWVAGYRKIKWAVCRKEDVSVFRAQLDRHASSINMLLITFQAQESRRRGETQAAQSSPSLEVSAPRSADRYGSDCDDDTARLLQGLSLEQRQFFRLLMSQNQQLQKSLDEIQVLLRVQCAIPPQVLLQQPVILLDAFGKIAPFHLEFIDSLDAFIAVLKIRSTQAGVQGGALRKLDNREFHIRDTRRRRQIDFTRPWAAIFRAGQNVDMSMVYRRCLTPSICPQCGCENEYNDDNEETECDSCGIWYYKISEEEQRRQPASAPSRPELESGAPSGGNTTYEEDSDFGGYRRIRIIPIATVQTRRVMEITEEEDTDTGYQISSLWEDQEYPAFMGKGKQRTPPGLDSLGPDKSPQKAERTSRAAVDDSPSARSSVRQFVQQRTVVCEHCDTRFIRGTGVDSNHKVCGSCRSGGRSSPLGDASSTRSQEEPATMGKHKVKNPARPSMKMKTGVKHRLPSGLTEKVARPIEPRRKVKEQIQWTLIDPRSR